MGKRRKGKGAEEAKESTIQTTRRGFALYHLLASVAFLLLLAQLPDLSRAASSGPRDASASSEQPRQSSSSSDDSSLSIPRRALGDAYRWGAARFSSSSAQKELPGDSYVQPDAYTSALDDLILGDIVVVSSLEGGIYGVDRTSGTTRWTLPPRVPLGQRTTEAFANATGLAWNETSSTSGVHHGDKVSIPLGFEPLIGQAYGPKKQSYAELAADVPSLERDDAGQGNNDAEGQSRASGQGDLDALRELGMYIVEPSSGQLYMLSSSPADSKTTLSKLPLTLPQLVDLSPFSFPGDASRVFVGHKRTSLVEIDVLTGKIGTVFGGSGGRGDSSDVWCNADEPFQAFRAEQQTFAQSEQCESDTDPAQQWAYMGRTDYTLTIHLRGRPSLSQTLSFSTFTPNAADRQIADLWLKKGRSADSRSLMGMPEEGSLICFNSSRATASRNLNRAERTLWVNELGVTVAGIFDVAYQVETLGNDSPAKPILLPHPPVSLRSLFSDGNAPLDGHSDEHTSINSILDRRATYLGLCNGHLYAMGHERFPLSAFTPRAPAAIDAAPGGDHDGSHPRQGSSSSCTSHGCLLGSYDSALDDEQRTKEGLLGLGPGREPLLGISDGRESLTKADPETSKDSDSFAGPHRSPLPAPSPASSSWTSPSMVMTQIIALFLLAILCGLVYIGGHELRRQRAEEAKAITRDMVWTPTAPGVVDRAPDASLVVTKEEAETDSRNRKSVAPLQDVDVAEKAETNGEEQEKKKPARRRKRGKRAGTAVAQREAKRDSSKENVLEEESGNEQEEVQDAQDTGQHALDTWASTSNGNGIESKGQDADAMATANGAMETVAPLSLEGGTVAPLSNGEKVAVRGENRSLVISDEVLGYGSSGTLVFRGTFQGRAVAVKRLLRDFVDVAAKEVTLLESADNHPNVIRYFYKEVTSSFLFIALELCPASLADIIEKPQAYQDISPLLKPKKALHQIASGLLHLHSLSIVHRDIKPQNILVSPKGGKLKMLLSDFGLSKRLDGQAQTSFSQTMNNPGGTVGWRAPEILRGDVTLDAGAESGSTSGSLSNSRPESTDGNGDATKQRLTRAVDIFALGCLAYYVLSNGEHPFGTRFEREMNILRKQTDVSRLDGLGEEGHEAQHMIHLMVRHDPKQRPSALQVLSHPYFWDAGRRLGFLQDASDRFDIMERDPPAAALVALETDAATALGGQDWHKRIDRQVMEDLNKRRKYDPKSVAALLRAIRNKKHHIHDCPPSVRRLFIQAGGASVDANKLLPDGFLAYFTTRFPKLFLHVYEVIDGLSTLKVEAAFAPYFAPAFEDD